MQSVLVNKLITREKIISFSEYKKIKNVNEYVLFGDNILEGITLLNDMVIDEHYLKFEYIIYEPIDQPIYVFSDEKKNIYAIKICGAYTKWDLPEEVSKIINYVDLPDYVIYSLKSKKVILAGENTETASVGNSQWQREGRKLGAAKIGVPFIYQTFYAGRDESQDTIREPSSLQVYNQLVYSVKYKVQSFVAYFENNFDNSQTRKREPIDSQKLFSKYLKSVFIYDVDKSFFEEKRKLEKEFYIHMINYLKEPKFKDIHLVNPHPRLEIDLPVLSNKMYNMIINKTDEFVEELLDYIYEENTEKINYYINNSELINFDNSKFENWTSYDNKDNIKNIISFLKSYGNIPTSYVRGSSKVGFVSTKLCNDFLIEKFPDFKEKIDTILNYTKYNEALLMPLRIHKVSNGNLTFSPDPESGEIVAFSELFGYNLKSEKERPVIGYCIVNTPDRFNILDKKGTKLYKAIAEYVDILIINDKLLITDLENDYEYGDYEIDSLELIKPKELTEEMAVVSTFINQTTINSDWKLCFIHTHHSSWQQLVIHAKDKEIQEKIDRVSTKVDLITQNKSLFMIAEGKNTYADILKDNKIKRAMTIASNKINFLYKDLNDQFDAFIYNLSTVPDKDPEFFATREAETVKKSIELGHFNDIAYHDSFVVIIVYMNSESCTKFKLVYSSKFDSMIKEKMDKEFNQ